MSRILLATTLAAAGASGILTASCPEVDIDISCNLGAGCSDTIVLIHGPNGKFRDPLDNFYTAGAEAIEMGRLAAGDASDWDNYDDATEILAMEFVDEDKLCGTTLGTGIAVDDSAVDYFAAKPTITVEPENNGAGCKCSDMYFTIMVRGHSTPGTVADGLLALFNHKLESTSEPSYAFGEIHYTDCNPAGLADCAVMNDGWNGMHVKFTPSGSSSSSWLNWWIFSHWF